MPSRLTVAVAEDHTIFRRQLVVALEQHPDVEVVAEAADLAQLASRLDQRPSVVLADTAPPGPDTARYLPRHDAPAVPPLVAVVGVDGDPATALVAGASAALAGWFACQPSDTHLAVTATIMHVRAVAVGARRTMPLAGPDGPPPSRQ